ncbi:hypothetical protein L218DRAFT_483117 [Marasmius fiardii PR-910]|nr:hypothetical protein L218DRAFT_483117 [Marasmius fiardii PR-910]
MQTQCLSVFFLILRRIVTPTYVPKIRYFNGNQGFKRIYPQKVLISHQLLPGPRQLGSMWWMERSIVHHEWPMTFQRVIRASRELSAVWCCYHALVM